MDSTSSSMSVARAIADGLIGKPKLVTPVNYLQLVADPKSKMPRWWFDTQAGGQVGITVRVVWHRHQASADVLTAEIRGEIDELDWRQTEDTQTFDSEDQSSRSS